MPECASCAEPNVTRWAGPHRGRVRRFARLLATVCCLSVAAAWFGSLFYWVEWKQRALDITAANGEVWANLPGHYGQVVRGCGNAPPEDVRFHYHGARVEISVERNPEGRLFWHLPSVWVLDNPVTGKVFSRSVLVPFWVLFLAALLPTIRLWWTTPRRPRPGFCMSCGYDLRGNSSGRCPECGTPAAPAVVPQLEAGQSDE